MIHRAYRPPRFASTADALAAIAAAPDLGALQMLWSRSLMRSKRVAAAYTERREALARANAEASAAYEAEGLW